METCGQMRCAVGPRKDFEVKVRRTTGETMNDDVRGGSSDRNLLEVASGSAYAPPSSLRLLCLNHVGAGNAVRFGDSGAAVTGYESPTRECSGEEPSKRRRRASRFDARSQNNDRRVIQQSFEPKENGHAPSSKVVSRYCPYRIHRSVCSFPSFR
jgi:hypothetical protein